MLRFSPRSVPRSERPCPVRVGKILGVLSGRPDRDVKGAY